MKNTKNDMHFVLRVRAAEYRRCGTLDAHDCSNDDYDHGQLQQHQRDNSE